MTPIGHAAFAYLAAAPRTRSQQAPLWAVFGAFLPDVIDKSLLVAGVFPWSRTVGHAAFLWGAALCVIALWDLEVRAVPRLLWVVFGGISHLVCDLVDDLSAGFESTGYVFTAWFGFPWTNPDLLQWQVTPAYPPTRAVSALEIGCWGLFIVYVLWRRRQATTLLRC